MQLALQWLCEAIYSTVAQRNNVFIIFYLPTLNVRSALPCTWDRTRTVVLLLALKLNNCQGKWIFSCRWTTRIKMYIHESWTTFPRSTLPCAHTCANHLQVAPKILRLTMRNFHRRIYWPPNCCRGLFSDHSSDLSSPGPSLTTLTLVDLPGVHFANDDQRMNDVTQQLVLEYIKKNTKSIIVIVSEVGDPTGDSAINLVMTQAEDFKTRTICVLTKPDKLRREDDMGKRVALNQSSFTLEDGLFILLRGTNWWRQYAVHHIMSGSIPIYISALDVEPLIIYLRFIT